MSFYVDPTGGGHVPVGQGQNNGRSVDARQQQIISNNGPSGPQYVVVVPNQSARQVPPNALNDMRSRQHHVIPNQTNTVVYRSPETESRQVPGTPYVVVTKKKH